MLNNKIATVSIFILLNKLLSIRLQHSMNFVNLEDQSKEMIRIPSFTFLTAFRFCKSKRNIFIHVAYLFRFLFFTSKFTYPNKFDGLSLIKSSVLQMAILALVS